MENLKNTFEEIISSWATQNNAGDFIIEPRKQKRLGDYSIKFHELNLNDFTDAIVVFTKALYFGKSHVLVQDEHLLMWTWGANLVTATVLEGSFVGKEIDYEKRRLFETFVRSFIPLPNFGSPSNELEANLENFLRNRSVLQGYLGFPFLERILKEKCGKFVDLNGNVIQDFVVNRSNGKKPRPYIVNDPYKNKISSIEDLLYFYLENIVSQEIKLKIEDILEHLLPSFDYPHKEKLQHGAQIIYSWRNSSLHGAENLQTIGGILLSIILLIEIDSIKEEFEIVHKEALMNYNHFKKTKYDAYYTLSLQEYYPYNHQWI